MIFALRGLRGISDLWGATSSGPHPRISPGLWQIARTALTGLLFPANAAVLWRKLIRSAFGLILRPRPGGFRQRTGNRRAALGASQRGQAGYAIAAFGTQRLTLAQP
jgi:hypothetical protein